VYKIKIQLKFISKNSRFNPQA